MRLKEWDPGYTANKKKEDIENELTQLSSQISELQYKFFCR